MKKVVQLALNRPEKLKEPVMPFADFLSFYGKRNDNCAHHITKFVVPLRTEEVSIVTIDAGHGHCLIRINSFEILEFPSF